MNIRTYLKECFQDWAILPPDYAESLPEKSIILQEIQGTHEVEIAKTKVLIANEALDPMKNYVLSISGVFPPRIRVSKPGEDAPKAYIPVADWDGKSLRIAVTESTTNTIVRNALFAGLPTLLRLNDGSESGASILRQKMSLGLTKERKQLLENAAKNREYVDKKMTEIQKFLESAVRQERIAESLKKLEQGELDEFAKSQWEDLQHLIPGVLQDVYIKDDYLYAITNPIVISSVLIGACSIQIHILSAKVHIFAVEPSTTRDGHCHPHVQNDGNPCWGNLQRSIADMSAKKDYYGIVNATLRLLYQYVHDDAYEKLNRWGQIAASPEDGANCQKYGPKHSYAQMRTCIACKETCAVTLREKIAACQTYRTPDGCTNCTIGEKECSIWNSRYEECFNFYIKAAPAYCMLKCENKNCPFVERAQQFCRTDNLPEEGDCPAADICRQPCKR